MGLERRGNGFYYYRKKRIGGRVVSEYVGGGFVATLAQALDRERIEQRERMRYERKQDAAQLATLKKLGDVLGVLVRAQLIAQGCHTHKGQWRHEQKTRRTKKRGAS